MHLYFYYFIITFTDALLHVCVLELLCRVNRFQPKELPLVFLVKWV